MERHAEGRATASRKTRGWGRSLLIAILLHVVVGFTLWRVAVRLHVGGSETATASTSSADPPRPVILQAMESIHSAELPAPLAAFEEQEPVVEWEVRPHARIEADWATGNGPLIGYPNLSSESAPLGVKAKASPSAGKNPDVQK